MQGEAKTARFGEVTVGSVPAVVGTLTTLQTLRTFATHRPRSCHIVEVRLDQIGVDDDWLTPCADIQSSGCPVLLTLRSAAEGGAWQGSDADRLQIIKRALPIVAAVDVEMNSALASQVVALARDQHKTVVASFHDFVRTPDFAALEAIAARMAGAGVVVKIATMIHSDADIKVLRRLLSAPRDYPLCVVGMGSKGTETRVAFAREGSCLTYGYLDRPAAPGQLSAAELMERLR